MIKCAELIGVLGRVPIGFMTYRRTSKPALIAA
jgi:hypothetical protein